MKRFVLFAAIAASMSCGKCGTEETTGDTGVKPGADVRADAASARDAAAVDSGGALDGGDTGGDPAAILGSLRPAPRQAGVSPDGVVDVTPVPGEARAAKFLAPDTGFHGLWAHCKEGDIKLFNGNVEACISGLRTNRRETLTGGALLDIRATGSDADDVFDFYIPRIGFNTVAAEKVEVVRDGTDGAPAVVRVTGKDMPLASFVGVVGDNLFSPDGLDVTLEYRLGPNSDFIEIITFVTNATGKRVQITRGDFLAMGDRLRTFREGVGFTPGPSEYQALHGFGNGYSLAWVVPEAPIRANFGALGDNVPWEITQLDQFVLEPDAISVYRGRLLVGDGSLDSVRTRSREELGLAIGTPRKLMVVDEAQAPVAGRMVEVFAGEDAVTADVTGPDGTITATLVPGSYRIVVEGVLGGGDAEETTTFADETEFTVSVPSPARLRIDSTSEGTPIASLVTLSSPLGSKTFGARSGQVVELMPGQWDVAIGHGPEFAASVQSVDVPAGGETVVTAELAREVDTTDWIAADFHQHMEPSPDSTVRVEDRILDNVAVGVELLTPTDHDEVTDVRPWIEEMGLTDVISTFPGVEISPAVTHMNLYPMDWVYELPGHGTVMLAELDGDRPRRRSIPEIIAIARELPSDPVVQLNHTRSNSGLFNLVDFDPEVGPQAVTHNWWTTDVDALEIMNRFADACVQYKDWAGFWNAGLRPSAIGSSDAHGLWGDVGSTRSYLHAPGVAANAITPELVRDAVRANRVTVASHAFIQFGGGMLPGDTVTATAGAPVAFPVQIQTPPWASIDTLDVIANGVVVQTLTVTPLGAVIDFDDVVVRAFTEDTWVAFVASGPAPSGEYQPSTTITYAFTNPVLVDVGGDGFTPPGPRPLDLDSMVFCR